MNSKTAKEMRQFIREEMPAILEAEYSKANHTKLAAEMRAIISQVVPKMLEEAAIKSIYEAVIKEVRERLDSIEKYIKEANEHRATKLEETLKAMLGKK